MSDDRTALPLAGQWAVVTGASMGIGLGVAGGLVADGANVVAVARDATRLDDACAELRGVAPLADQQVLSRPADVSSPASIAELFADVAERAPHLNVVVANAGSGTVVPFLDIDAATWERTLALNLTGTFFVVQAAARLMRDQPHANQSIVVVSSIRAEGARPGRLAYATTKAGLNQMARVAAAELAPLGIRVNILSPGITRTPLSDLNPQAFAEAVASVPMGRAGTPVDMGDAVRFLAGPVSSFVTGTNLIVDGGEHLW